MNQIPLMIAMAVASVAGAGGQIMLKKATDAMNGFSPIALATNWYLWGFAILYGIGVIINIGAYKLGGKVQLLYPMISLSYICAAFFAWKFLGESVSGWTWFGTTVIVLGVSIIGYGASIGT